MPASRCGTTAQALNSACFCITLDPPTLARALEDAAHGSTLSALLHERCPYVFSAQPVFVAPHWLRQMREVIQAIERVVQTPAWCEQALAQAPAIARHAGRGARGVFFGFDFHLSDSTLGLLEINTNAGGALLNTLLARAQRRCCQGVQPLSPDNRGAGGFEQAIVAMFRQEWAAAGNGRPLQRIAIVDENPPAQYLYAEFLLFQRLFRAAGIDCLIAAPSQLAFTEGSLRVDGQPIDLVYNRLTDFYLEDDSTCVLREAYLADAVSVTPHPRAYALYADKRRLIELTDMQLLERLGIDPHTRQLLAAHIPHTIAVEADSAPALWEKRRQLFFKPVSGYGSRGAYRGDKLTRRVWEEIVQGGYIAQALVIPGERQVGDAQQKRAMKFDLRAYVYAGEVQWTAARVYQGQTTNFRSEGGGFAPVYTLDEHHSQPPAAHASYTFLLDDAGEVVPLPAALYQALIRAEPAPPELRGQRYRLADWYVAMAGEKPERLVREWYGWVRIDEDGRFDPTAAPAEEARTADNIDRSALPSARERARLQVAVFGG